MGMLQLKLGSRIGRGALRRFCSLSFVDIRNFSALTAL
jgi:hypothetical protein